MADATTTHGFWELMRIARWHVEGEAYDRALSVVVEAQAALPMAAVWGTGRTASSDGQFFPAAGRGEALNLVNARYGTEPGVKAYSHVSDRFSPFATQTIPATVHEAPYILDGLLMNETGRRVREQYADTGGFTDHVFAACSILGYAFVPRIRDLPSKRLYVFERAGVPKQLRPLVGGKVNADLISPRQRCLFAEPVAELTRRVIREGPESVQPAQLGKMLVPGLGPHRVVGQFVPVEVELAADEIHHRRRNELARRQQAARVAEHAQPAAQSPACCGNAGAPRCAAGPRRSGCSGAAGPLRAAEVKTGPTVVGRSRRFSEPFSLARSLLDL